MVALIILGTLLAAGSLWFVVYCFKHAKEQRVFGVLGGFMVLIILGCLAAAIYFTAVDKPAKPKRGGMKMMSIQKM